MHLEEKKTEPDLSAIIVHSILAIIYVLLVAAPALSGSEKVSILQIDRTRSGTYSAEDWKYIYTVTNPGTRSQGAVGRLLYKGTPLPLPKNLSDSYNTPLGRFYYVGEEGPIWEDLGWVPALTDNNDPLGNNLPVPSKEPDTINTAKNQIEKLIKTLTLKGSQSSCFLEPEQELKLAQEDPWGAKYRSRVDIRGGEGEGEVVRLVIQSAGPDTVFGTDDDIEKTSVFFQLPNQNVESELELMM